MRIPSRPRKWLPGFLLFIATTQICAAENQLVDPRDHHVYRTTKIGRLTWMAENIDFGMPNTYCYENDVDMCEKFGRLYSWSLAQKACPDGWRLPGSEDFDTLLDLTGDGRSGWVLKANYGWAHPGSDRLGFSAKPSGAYMDGRFMGMDDASFIWSSSEDANGKGAMLFIKGDTATTGTMFKKVSAAVRCVKEAVGRPAVPKASANAGAKSKYMDFLRRKGYGPKLLDNGNIGFTTGDNGTFLLLVESDDPEYFGILYPGFWKIESEQERLKAIEAANSVTGKNKVAKVVVANSNTHAGAEVILARPEDFEKVFPRMMKEILDAIEAFKGRMAANRK